MTNSRMNLSRRKKMLLKTHTQFDGSSSGLPAVSCESEGLHSQVVSVSLQQATPNSLVIQALIQQVCIHMEQDGRKRKMLYSAICKVLNEQKIFGMDFGLDELWPLKQKFCNVLSRFFSQVHNEISSQGFGSCTSLAVRSAIDYVRTDYSHCPSRYQQSFVELEKIAKGGFGVVCKAQDKVDGITYAVKKIKFMYTNDVDFKKVLREVRSFALLKHQNIVNYNSSWLETNVVTGSTVYRTSSDSESYSSDNEQQMSNNSLKTKSNENHDISPIFTFSSEASTNNNEGSSGQNSDLTALLIDSLNHEASVETHSIVINSEVQIFHQVEGCQIKFHRTSEENIEHLGETKHFNKSSPPEQQVFHDVEFENSDSKNNSMCRSVDESGDHCQKSTSRRRRHSSGATCSSVCDQASEVHNNKKDIPNPRSYERVNSLDLDAKRCTELVPKRADIKWDISNLNVTAVLYIQMELCDRSLREWLDERADLPSSCCKREVIVGNSLRIFKQIVQGVEHIHSKFVIHRDLKPQNIFWCNDGFIKIGDFGLATLCTHTDDTEFFHSTCSCSHSQGIGTAPYSAPEQRKGSSYDNKVDIYSLGIILIELLHPYQTRMEFFSTIDKILGGSIPIEFVDVWPKEVVNLIRKLTGEDPQKRPEANEVLNCLKRFKASEPASVGSSREDIKNRESAALEISNLKAQIRSLERQLSEKDETIKELRLKLLYSNNCDSFV